MKRGLFTQIAAAGRLLGVLIVLLMATSPLEAQIISRWIGGDPGPSPSGVFNISANWNNGIPTILDTAIFDLDDTYTVTFSNDRHTTNMSLSYGNVTFVGESQAQEWLIGNDAEITTYGQLHLGGYFKPVSLNISSSLDVTNGGLLNADFSSSVTTDTLTVAAETDLDYYSVVSVDNGSKLIVSDTTALNPMGSIEINSGEAYLGDLDCVGGAIYFNSGYLNINNDLRVGTEGPFEGISLTAAHMLVVGGTTTIDPFRTLSLNDGTFTTGKLITGPYLINDQGDVANGIMDFNRGTLNITDITNHTVDQGLVIGVPVGYANDPINYPSFISKPLGNIVTLGFEQTLNVTHSTTVESGALLRLEDGGAFNRAANTGPIDNSGEILFNGATAILGGSELNNLAGGLVCGEGRITCTLTNGVGAEVRIEENKRLLLCGGENENLGKINLLGGMLEINPTSPSSTPSLTNDSTGQILGHGTLILGGTGLANQGNIAFSGGLTDVFGTVANNTGSASRGINITGNSDVIFWDKVTHTSTPASPSLFGVSTGSSATFCGAYGGAGISGWGNKFFESTVIPGDHPDTSGMDPADISFGGNVYFGSKALLEIEIGGLTPGTNHDRVNVAQTAFLDGTLDLSLINTFLPAAGNEIILMTYGARTGAFSQVNFDNLPTSLQYTLLYRATDLLLQFSAGSTTEKIWGVDADGNSSAGANWIGGIAPGAVDEKVGFSNVITADRTVTVDSSFTAGTLRFDDDNGYLVAGSQPIVLDVSTGNAAIQVNTTNGNGAHAIAAPVTLQDNLVVVQNSTGTFTLAGALDNASGKSIAKAGPGTLSVEGAQTWGNNTAVEVQEGTLRFALSGTDTAALGTGIGVTVDSGAILELAGSVAALSDGTDSAGVLNDGLLLVSGTNQAAGAISGAGATTVLDGADLTVPSITQDTLIIGGTAPAPRANSQPVPEPATVVLLAAAAALLLLRRRSAR